MNTIEKIKIYGNLHNYQNFELCGEKYLFKNLIRNLEQKQLL